MSTVQTAESFEHYGKLIINIDFPGPWFSKNKINGICVSKFAQKKMWGKFDKKICYKNVLLSVGIDGLNEH
jgi:hypothetical protein